MERSEYCIFNGTCSSQIKHDGKCPDICLKYRSINDIPIKKRWKFRHIEPIQLEMELKL